MDIKYIRNTKLLGISNNTNNAIKNASCDKIKIMYMDDILLEDNALLYFREVLRNNTWAVCYSKHIDMNEKVLKLKQPHWTKEILKGEYNSIGMPSVMGIRKNEFEFDPKLKTLLDCEYMWLLHRKYGPPAIIPKYLVGQRIWKKSTSNVQGSLKNEEYKYLVEKHNIQELKAIDVVYTLGTGSKWHNNEIRYSLRSIEKHLKNIRNVYIIGAKPDFLKNIIHIPAQDNFHPSRNIMEKLLIACRQNEITEDFIFFNDDFFLLNDIDALNYPYYHDGDIARNLEPKSKQWYQDYIRETLSALNNANLPTTHFDIHTPIIYNKFFFPKAMQQFDWKQKLIVKSMYCNSLKIQGQLLTDCKIMGWKTKEVVADMIKNRHVFSIGDLCLSDVYPARRSPVKTLLEKLFPNKSKYEL